MAKFVNCRMAEQDDSTGMLVSSTATVWVNLDYIAHVYPRWEEDEPDLLDDIDGETYVCVKPGTKEPHGAWRFMECIIDVE